MILTQNEISPTKIKPNLAEVYRYLGYNLKKSGQNTDFATIDHRTRALVDECIKIMWQNIRPKSLYDFFDLTLQENSIHFADVTFSSKSLAKNLAGCTKIALLATTLGNASDMLIKKYTCLDITKAAIMQACGAMFIEEYTNIVNHEIQQMAATARCCAKPRFSPGFGDVPLSLQKDFFRLLPLAKQIGLTLMDSGVMAPEKSVTAFIGIYTCCGSTLH